MSLGADVNRRRTARTWMPRFIDSLHLDPKEEGERTPLMFAARNGHVD
jgi:hypothetical protein